MFKIKSVWLLLFLKIAFIWVNMILFEDQTIL